MSDIKIEIPVIVPPALIFGKILDLRRAIGGLQAKKSNDAYGPKFPVKSAKELMEKLRDAADDLRLVVSVVEQVVIPLTVESVPDPRGGEGAMKAGGTCCYVTVTVRVEAEDGSYRDFRGCGGAMDKDDKAAGKASTYAWKDALIKGLSLPDAEMVDTDDQSGHGKDVKPRGKAPTGKSFSGGKTPSATSEREAQARRAVETAGSLEALEILKEMLEKLPEQEQLNLSPVYKARKKFLTEAGA